MAGVGLKGALSPMCGGAVVSDQYVLTAAHCCDGKQAAELQVDLGDHDWSHGAEADNFRVGVAAVKMFPGYQHGNNLNNDVCLLRLARVLSFPAVPGVRPVCLPPDTADTYADRAALVAGWGKTGSGNGISNVLLETELVVWPQVSSLLRESISTSTCILTVPVQADCRAAYWSGMITSAMMCVAKPASPIDSTCNGDSGSSVIVRNGDNYDTVGVVSWGIAGCRAGAPSVMARVTSFLSWIRTEISDSALCPRSYTAPPTTTPSPCVTIEGGAVAGQLAANHVML